MELKEGYKKTKVGLIPKDWKVQTIGGICEIFIGRDLKEKEFSTYQTSEHRFPVFSNTVSNFGIYGYYTSPEYKFEGVTVVGRGVGLGTAFYRKPDFGGIGRLIILKPINDLSQFISYYINNSISIFLESGGIPQLTGISFSKYKIPLPPLPEQTAIATVLSDTDQLIQAIQKKIAKKRLIIQGAMQELLRPKEGWEFVPFDKVFSFNSTSNYSKAEMSTEGEVGCMHYGLVHAIPNTLYDLKNGIKYYVTNKQAKYALVRNGDVIMVDASEDIEGINKSVEISGVGNQKVISGLHTYLLRDFNSSFVAKFRGIILNSPFVKKQMHQLAVGMKVFGVSKTQMTKIHLPIPKREEQLKIATILSDMDTEIEQLEKQLAKYKEVKQGLMQNLLTGKIRLV